jgi:hypothetical protein
MSPKQVEQLFEPFSNSTTGGTGLGLSIVYQIVRDHSGSINVRSTEGGGTTITIEIPKESKNHLYSKPVDAKNTEPETMKLEEFLTVGEGESENTA